MCYQLTELYSHCGCKYYEHAPEKCSSNGEPDHEIERRTTYVQYTCPIHQRQREGRKPSGLADSQDSSKEIYQNYLEQDYLEQDYLEQDYLNTFSHATQPLIPVEDERPSVFKRHSFSGFPSPTEVRVERETVSYVNDCGETKQRQGVDLVEEDLGRDNSLLTSWAAKEFSDIGFNDQDASDHDHSADDDVLDEGDNDEYDEVSSVTGSDAPSSILSLQTTASTTITTTSEGNGDIITRLLRDLLAYPQLEHLLPQLVRQSRSRATAEKHITRFLRRYSKDLRMRCSSKIEIDASKFIQSCSANIAAKIVDHYMPEIRGEEAHHIEAEAEEAREDSKLQVEDEGTENDESEKATEISYEELREFLFESQPFESLKLNIRVFVEKLCAPESGTQLLDKARIQLMNQYDSLLSKVLGPDPKKRRLWWNCVSCCHYV